jgi:hypothetical protein
MCYCFVRLVVSVRAGEFLLVMHQFLLLQGCQDRKLVLFHLRFLRFLATFEIRLCIKIDTWERISILELWESALLAQPPGEVVVVRDEYHMVRIYSPKGSKAIANYSEQCHENVVNHVDDVVSAAAEVDPACCPISECEL